MQELPRVEGRAGESREEQIVMFLAETPQGRTRQEVEEFFGISRVTALKTLGKLNESGRVNTVGKARSLRYVASGPGAA